MPTVPDIATRQRVGAETLAELRRNGGAGINVTSAEQAVLIMETFQHIPMDGSDYEWSIVLLDVAWFLADCGGLDAEGYVGPPAERRARALAGVAQILEIREREDER